MRFLLAITTFIVLACPSFAQNYILKPGDVMAVEVLEDQSLNRNVLVLPDGSITFPFAGTIRAGGRSVADVQSNLRNALAPNFAAPPTIFVSVNSLAAPEAAAEAATDLITVYIIGQVNRPGPVEIEPGINFLQALSVTGGFTPFAATKRIQLRRSDPSTGEETVYKFNLKAVGNGARISGNTTMRDGDIIFVPERRLFE